MLAIAAKLCVCHDFCGGYMMQNKTLALSVLLRFINVLF